MWYGVWGLNCGKGLVFFPSLPTLKIVPKIRKPQKSLDGVCGMGYVVWGYGVFVWGMGLCGMGYMVCGMGRDGVKYIEMYSSTSTWQVEEYEYMHLRMYLSMSKSTLKSTCRF